MPLINKEKVHVTSIDSSLPSLPMISSPTLLLVQDTVISCLCTHSLIDQCVIHGSLVDLWLLILQSRKLSLVIFVEEVASCF